MDPGARVNVVIYGPVMSFATVRERTSEFLETGIEREIMSNGILVDLLGTRKKLRMKNSNAPSSLRVRF